MLGELLESVEVAPSIANLRAYEFGESRITGRASGVE